MAAPLSSIASCAVKRLTRFYDVLSAIPTSSIFMTALNQCTHCSFLPAFVMPFSGTVSGLFKIYHFWRHFLSDGSNISSRTTLWEAAGCFE